MCVCVYRAHYNFFFCWVPIARAYRVCAMCVCVCLIPFHSPPYIEKNALSPLVEAAFPGKCYRLYMSRMCICFNCVYVVCCARYHHITMVVFLEKIDYFLSARTTHTLSLVNPRVSCAHKHCSNKYPFLHIYMCVCINNINTVTVGSGSSLKVLMQCSSILPSHFFFSRRLFVRVASCYVFFSMLRFYITILYRTHIHIYNI